MTEAIVRTKVKTSSVARLRAPAGCISSHGVVSAFGLEYPLPLTSFDLQEHRLTSPQRDCLVQDLGSHRVPTAIGSLRCNDEHVYSIAYRQLWRIDFDFFSG